MVWRREVEVNTAKRAISFSLAEDDRYLLVERNTVAEIGASILVSLDRFFHEGDERRLAFLRRFIETYDVFLESLQGFSNFRLKGINRHGRDSYFSAGKTQEVQNVRAATRS